MCKVFSLHTLTNLLTHTHTEPSCDLFNFSLSGIGAHEKAVKSELNLYMVPNNEKAPPPTGRFCVVIEKYEEGNKEYVISLDVAADKPAGWIKFNVQHIIAPLIPAGMCVCVCVCVCGRVPSMYCKLILTVPCAGANVIHGRLLALS